ncbi:MAG: hypothetical protein ACOH2R_17515 [Pseudomonas sp.]
MSLLQIHFRSVQNLSTCVEVGTRDSSIRIEVFDHQPVRDMYYWVNYPACRAEAINTDLVMLYEYLKEPGRVINLTADIASQTIKFLKETN